MLHDAWLIPLIPAISFFLILFFGKRLPKKGSEIGIGALGLAFVLALVAAAQWIGKAAPREAVHAHHTWFNMGGIDFGFGIHVDGLTVMMLVVVTFISLMVHIYSTGYMHGDRRFTYFFAALSLFTSAMLMLVVADNTLQLMIGWELVGLCSFMLIGHWWEEGVNSGAAIKAFITTRTGDVGLMLGIITLFFAAGRNFDIEHLNHQALTGGISHRLLLVGACLLFLGVMGKSAQFPLHVWLPDAMAGPTPVSALIHAATMVVAGVYLVARLYGVFYTGFSISAGGVNFVAIIGAITVLIAAALAFVQDDVKKVLAYSTVSQLGYMVMALGVGAWSAGVFHLFTHAFFKALLFLGSGSLIHSVHSNNMSEMGGLRKKMPTTFWTFIVGSVALAGIFPLAGFWSKDEILNGASSNGYPLMLIVGVIGAFMTAAYMTRACYLIFAGEYRGHGHPHESPPSMAWPLRILAVPAALAGLLNAPGIGLFHKWVDFEVPGVPPFLHEHSFNTPLAAFSLAIAFAGIGVAAGYYFRNAFPLGLSDRVPILKTGERILVHKYYLDDLFLAIIRGIQYPVAKAAYWFNQHVLDGVINGVGKGAQRTAAFTYEVIDQRVIDGMVNGAGNSAEESGSILRHVQSGRVQQYAAVLFGAAAVFAIGLVFLT
ncbi:MAG TPA: NADH-quinone oxidoreductase subunit L [Acidimicrobiales bacterium]|jgi:NADH-quinone oxidoreductase subunit L|nr:NADH-quinone oxidoreductase subunit L [Acidimicrobiales bacterium]